MTIARRTFRIRVGAVLLALGTVQFFAAHVIAQRAWPTPYSWTTNYISDLGAVTCAPGSSDAVCSHRHFMVRASRTTKRSSRRRRCAKARIGRRTRNSGCSNR